MKNMIASIYKRKGRDKYTLEYKEGNTVKQKQLSSIVKKESVIEAMNFMIDLTSQQLLVPKNEQIESLLNERSNYKRSIIGTETVNTSEILLDIYTDFNNTKKSNSERSQEDYKRLGNILYDYNLRWEHLTVKGIMTFQDTLLKTKALDTVGGYMVLFKAFLRFCLDSKYLTSDIIFPLMSICYSKQKQKKTPAIPQKVMDLILKEIKSYDKDFSLLVRLLSYTGCRPAEIIKLNKYCLIPNTLLINIYQPKTKKTKHRELTEEFYKECEALFLCSKTEFAFPHGQKVRYYNNCWNQLMTKLKLRHLIKGSYENMYDMRQIRHSAISKYYNETKNKDKAQAIGDHSNFKITSKYIDPSYGNETIS